MAFTPSSPVTGAAQTGLTSPTYTLTADVAPDANGKQYAVTALGGTQTGVGTHSIADPFTSTLFRPKNLRVLGQPDSLGVIRNVPRNTFKLITRKGVLPLTGQARQTMLIHTVMEVPAGVDTADPLALRAALSLHYGLLWQQSSGIGDTVITGII